MDSIKRGIERNFCKEINDRREMSVKMAHLISTIINESYSDVIKDKEFYIIDTCHIYPVEILGEKLKNVIIIFLGYPNISVEDKLKNIREYDKINIWSNSYSNDELRYGIELGIKYSKIALNECEKYDIKFYDTGKNFEETINEAYKYIESELKNET